MAGTLEGFLSRNTLYDSSRASLMLVGTIALVVSSEPSLHVHRDENENINIVDRLSNAKSPSDTVVWPIKCLLRMAVARNCLSSTLLLLNSTIPNELRWRRPKGKGLITSPRPSLGLFVAAVETILESSGGATRTFLDLFDEESGLTYWFSIQDDTRLALCLFSVNGKHVLIQQPEVRAWVLERLKGVLESPIDRTHNVSYLPNEWLREIITGVFCNAECDLSLGMDTICKSVTKPGICLGDSECYRQDMIYVQDLLIPSDESGGLDFDILIPSLLLLSMRNEEWKEGSSICTQTLLNGICDLAGRKTLCTPRFLFDGRTVMRQCALADNIQAAAFLIGGRSGLILECADLLITMFGLPMKDAEIALFGGSLAEMKEILATWNHNNNTETRSSSIEWSPSKEHQHILWLLQNHVLNVSTYGDFDIPSRSIQGKITPVTAGRIW